MRLKSIKLAGFKSFVDATTVPFISNMTAIVGPNGCGKSNIIDAVRWVMGESSAKNLRGESMSDVIFNGSSERQLVGQASIELLFDNCSGKLTGEYAAFSEISIKRKVTREGTSQYYLNGTKCRRRDVTDIFLGTGMGPRSYAIIEQGMITRLIESKPEELRVYLEEAAGISKYKERRRETENRMKRAQDNLDRLSDIRDELGKQLQHLKRQASAAERYADYKKQQRFTTAKLNAVHWQSLDQQRLVKADAVSEREMRIEKVLHEKLLNQNCIEGFRSELEDAQQAFNKLQAAYYQSGAKIATLEQKLKYQKERLQQQDKEQTQLNQELNLAKAKVAADTEQLENVARELEDLSPVVEEAIKNAECGALERDQNELGMTRWQQAWDQYNKEAASLRQTASVKQSAIRQVEVRLQQLFVRKEKLEKEQSELKSQLSQDDAELLETQLQDLKLRLDEVQTRADALLPKINHLRRSIEKNEEARLLASSALSEKKAVLASLNTLQNAALGKDEQVLAWLDQHDISSVVQLLDEVSVRQGWEMAVEHVLASWLKGVLVDQFESLRDTAFDNLNQSLTLIKRTAIPTNQVYAGTLASCVSGAPVLIDFLNTIKLADSYQDAVSRAVDLLAGESLVTPQGLWVGKDWIKSYQASEGQSGFVARKERIVLLLAEISEIEQHMQARTALVGESKQQLKKYEDQQRHFEALFKDLSQESARLASQQSVNEAKRDQFRLRVTRNADDLSEVIEGVETEQDAMLTLKGEWQAALTALDVLNGDEASLMAQRTEIQDSLDRDRQQARELQQSAHQLQLELHKKQSHQVALKQSVSRLKEEVGYIQGKIKALDSVESVDEASLFELEAELESLLEFRLRHEEDLSNARVKTERLASSLRDAESNRSRHESALQDDRGQLEQLRMDCQALEINQRTLLEAVEADGFDLNALIVDGVESESELEENLRRLTARIQKLGPINLAAIDEYQVQSQRKAYLDDQNEDLLEALEFLLSAIRKIDKETRARFKETYDLVNEGLQRLFPKIFGGGNACLELTDDDLLATGVSIIARPPGKKNATIHLLSGGEKALTAIALIFAIFELNPAPFCMLDEVDAPLDDTNVGRFANLVKEMSAQVQFIYISHNKVSMEKADQLMGVTMHEPGVSRLVSVDVEEAVAMVEA